MEGFFSREQTQSKSRPDGKVYSCASCGAKKNSCNPNMPPTGNFKKKILLIGGINSNLEDKRGQHWQSPSGRYLEKALADEGIDLFEDCLSMNAVNCVLEDSANISYQISCCRTNVIKTIEAETPKLIIIFGLEAIESIIGTKWKKDLGELFKWRGWTIPFYNFNAWVCPIFHPSFFEPTRTEAATVWKQDLRNALSKLDMELPIYKEPTIKIIEDLSELDLINTDLIAFDYECTGIKPHRVGHKIICASIAISKSKVLVFMMPDSKKKRQPFINLLKNNLIGKMSHNIKYEQAWTRQHLGVDIQNWQFDSMLAAHIIDNRKGITGLKFQSFVHFGVAGYDDDVAPWLRSGDKDGNAINRIEELIQTAQGREKLMTYCALDSIYEFRLAKLQMQQMNYQLFPF